MDNRLTRDLVYLVLAVALGCSGAFLGWVIYSVMNAPPVEAVVNANDLLQPREREDVQPATGEQTVEVFGERNVFEEIVTPLPTPTREVKPTAAPTARPIAPHWKLRMVMDDSAGIQDFTGAMQFLHIGDVYQEFRLKSVDPNNNTATVEDPLDGRTRVLTVE